MLIYTPKVVQIPFLCTEMSLFIASLNSGSNGNCYYIGNEQEAILIDAGISCRETEARMRQLDLSPDKLKAIFITHEHTDHIRGLTVLSKKYGIPVYITPKTLKSGRLELRTELVNDFTPHEPVEIGNLSVTPFPKIHDADDPHSFIVSGNGINIAVITDIGICCNEVTYYFRQCHAAILESNYDEEMLANGPYPLYLKRRISGGKGHISNQQALDFLVRHKPQFMTHVLLAHLSRENNHPDLVQELFSSNFLDSHMIVASRDSASEVYHITGTSIELRPRRIVKPVTYTQLSLF